VTGLPFEYLSEQQCGLCELLLLVADGACLEVGFCACGGVVIGGAEEQECLVELSIAAGDVAAEQAGVCFPFGQFLQLVGSSSGCFPVILSDG